MHDDRRLAWTPGDGHPRTLTLRDCSTGSTRIVVRGPLRASMIDLAFVILQANQALTKGRLPESLWKDALQKVEEDGLTRLAAFKDHVSFDRELFELTEGFASRLNRTIKSRRLRLPEVKANPECGGPPSEYQVLTRPKDGSVAIISKFYYIVCQKQRIDPNDASRCDHWFPPIRHGERQALGGIYKYRIRWSDRATDVKEFDADRYTRTDTITLE
jgi:hypothetical protein